MLTMTKEAKINKLLFSDKIKENRSAFFNKLFTVSDNLSIKADWLMLVFYIETGASNTGEINHRAQNKATKATGLIQFMPATARSLGTTTTALQNMTNVEQLDYVERYLQPYASRIKSYTDCYLAVLFPAAIGKPSGWVLETKNLTAETVARFNPLYDLNKDGKITVGEVGRKLRSFLPKNYEE